MTAMMKLEVGTWSFMNLIRHWDEALFRRRHEEGYNIYNEDYARWLLKEHPTEAPSEWVKKLQDLEEGNNHCTKTLPLKALLVIGEISQVTRNDPPSQQLSEEGHSSDLYIRCYEEGTVVICT